MLSIPNAPTSFALANEIGRLNNTSPVSADTTDNLPSDALTSAPAAPGSRDTLPRFKQSVPLISSLQEHRISKRETQGKGYFSNVLLEKIKQHFREYATGQNDRFVNFDELREAAGQKPTTRTFSAEATLYAKVLLSDPALLRRLDIGVGDNGYPGAEDGRFDLENLDYLIRKITKDQKRGRGSRITWFQEK